MSDRNLLKIELRIQFSQYYIKEFNLELDYDPAWKILYKFTQPELFSLSQESENNLK